MRKKLTGHVTFLICTVMIFLAVNHLAQWWVYDRLGFHDNFRFENGAQVQRPLFDTYIDYIKQEKDYKIGFLGDSVVQGAGVENRSETIPAYLQKNLNNQPVTEQVKVFNLGLPGARPADIYMTLKRLHQEKAVDFFIINISYPFFSDEMAANPMLYYRVFRENLTKDQLVQLKVPEEDETAQDDGPLSQKAASSSPAEAWLQDNILKRWSVYRFRNEINRQLFGGHPMALLTGENRKKNISGAEKSNLPEKDRPENKYKRWDSFGWSEEDKLHLLKVFDVKSIDNVDGIYYRLTCEYLQEHQIPAIIFMSPVNHRLLQKYELVDYSRHREISEKVARETKSFGIPFYDFQNSISGNLFHDSVHMLNEGNRRLAGDLSTIVKNALKKYEIKGDRRTIIRNRTG